MTAGNPPDNDHARDARLPGETPVQAPDGVRNEPASAETPFFSARLTPHRSLGPVGFRWLMVFMLVVCFASGLAFAAVGAWPVFAFFGLDVAIVYVAFRISYAQARGFEEVHVSASDVHVVRVSPRGATQDFHLNPAWARLDVTRLDDEGVVALKLVSHGRAFSIGEFLNPPDRATFADALSRALFVARSGGPALRAEPS